MYTIGRTWSGPVMSAAACFKFSLNLIVFSCLTLFSMERPSMLFAETHRPRARDSMMNFVRKSFLKLKSFLGLFPVFSSFSLTFSSEAKGSKGSFFPDSSLVLSSNSPAGSI